MENIQSISGFWPIFGLGILGSLAMEVLRWWNKRTSVKFPKYARTYQYWLITSIMIVVSGLIATLYGLESRNPISIVQLGASAPALLAAMAEGKDLLHNDKITEKDPLGESSSEIAGAEKGSKVQFSSKHRFNASNFWFFISFRG